MDSLTLVIVASILGAAIAVAIGGYGPGRAMGEALSSALDSLARQPEASGQILRTLFVGMALIESIAIYAFVISLTLLFANPLIGYVLK